MVEDGAFSRKIDYVTIFSLSRIKSQRASKLHYWFKGYGNLAELGDFAYLWSFIVKGLHATCEEGCFPIHPVCLVLCPVSDTLYETVLISCDQYLV